ncbi:plastocyanin [Alicyclobacillus sp. SO9]|nr:plastocyanin [Alicyclobacillus sp. SO9]
METSLQNATLSKNTNTVTYRKQNVTVVFFAGPEQADGKFVVGGLVNPTIQVRKGAHVQFKVINMDTGMPHGIEMTTANPPYSYMSMMQGGIYPGSFIAPLPEAQNGQYAVASSDFVANQSGHFHYLCQVPGHAAKGMYGKMIVS